MHAPIALVFLACLAASATAFLRPNKNVYSSFAAKFGIASKEVSDKQPLQTIEGNTDGYLVATSYLNNNECMGDPYAIEWITLGYCGVYHANATDPASPDPGCGNYVLTSAYQTFLAGYGQYILEYAFFQDSACTIPGEALNNSTCTREISINSTCTDDSSDGISSSVVAQYLTWFDLPDDGYSQMYVFLNSGNCIFVIFVR